MESIKKFNALNGKTVSRKELLSLKRNALKEGSGKVVSRITVILNRYPDYDQFNVSIKDPIKLENGLGAVNHTGIEKEALDECGRLKAGYKYLKGGLIEKVEKKETKKTRSTKKDIPVKASAKITQKKRAAVIKKQETKIKKIIPGKSKGLGIPANIEVSEIIFQDPAPLQLPAVPVPLPVKKLIIQRPEETKPAAIPAVPSAIAKSKNPLVKSMAERSGSGEFYELPGGLGEFIGRIEKKPKESVVITLDAPQGSGKTRLLFQIMNLVASMGMRVLYLSFEEHPDSDLFTMKRDQYIDPANHGKIDTIAELPNGYADFKTLVPEYDWIFTDSFGKKEILCGGRFDLDKDQRKAFDGKVFVDIYQRTQDGKMRGGSVAQFDADAVMKIDKDPTGNYKKNIAFFDKHRYHTRPLNELRYNIFHQEMEGTYAELSDDSETGSAEIAEII